MGGLTDFRLEWDSFWSAFHAKREEKHLHEAKFADLHMYKEMLKRREEGVPSHILGNGYLNRRIRVYPSPQKREIGNVLDLGEGGLGKTNREKVEIAEWDGSIVINDIKGDLRRTTAGIRKKRFPNGRILTLNINGLGNQYDPLKEETQSGNSLPPPTIFFFGKGSGKPIGLNGRQKCSPSCF